MYNIINFHLKLLKIKKVIKKLKFMVKSCLNPNFLVVSFFQNFPILIQINFKLTEISYSYKYLTFILL